MLFRAAVVLGVLTALCSSHVCSATTSVEVTNNCNEQIDPGFYPVVYNSAGEATGGFVLDSHEHAKVTLPTTGWTGIIWPRTGCDEYGRCETGQCPGGISCTAFPGPVGGATTARFIIANETGGVDNFYPSTYDGFNVPIRIIPGPGCAVDYTECTGVDEGIDCGINSQCPAGVSYNVIFC